MTVLGWTQALWSTNTAGNSGARITMQGDGDLVLNSSSNAVLWKSAWSGPIDSYRLVMQNDGNAVCYTSAGHAIWSTKYGQT